MEEHHTLGNLLGDFNFVLPAQEGFALMEQLKESPTVAVLADDVQLIEMLCNANQRNEVGVRPQSKACHDLSLELMVVLALHQLLYCDFLAAPLAQIHFGRMARSNDLCELQFVVVQQVLIGVLRNFSHDEVAQV